MKRPSKNTLRHPEAAAKRPSKDDAPSPLGGEHAPTGIEALPLPLLEREAAR
jgi:hypothetical protein